MPPRKILKLLAIILIGTTTLLLTTTNASSTNASSTNATSRNSCRLCIEETAPGSKYMFENEWCANEAPLKSHCYNEYGQNDHLRNCAGELNKQCSDDCVSKTSCKTCVGAVSISMILSII